MAGGIAEKCLALAAYAFFVGRVRRYNGDGGKDLTAAVDSAIGDCIAEGHMPGYFGGKRAEVRDMFMTEYDAELQSALDRADGLAEGLAKGRLEALTSLVRDGLLPLDVAAERAGMTPEQFQERAAALEGAGL